MLARPLGADEFQRVGPHVLLMNGLLDDGAAHEPFLDALLEELEEQAFDFVRQGRTDRARRLLYSPEYERQKQIYTKGMHDFRHSLHIAIQQDREDRQRANNRLIVVVLGIVLVFCLVWIMVYRMLGRWQANMHRSYRAATEDRDSLRREVEHRTRAETALVRSEERFKDFAEASSDWLWELDENLRFSYFYGHDTGLDTDAEASLIGKTLEELGITPEANPAICRRLRAELSARRPFRNRVFRRAYDDGRVAHFSFGGRPVFDEAGNFEGYRGTGTDITALKQHEEALLQAKADAERAAEVAEELAERADAASRMKTEFLATMSHEIRTPMNGVLGGTELLWTTKLSRDQKCHLKAIKESATGLLALLNDILDISKIESGHITLEEIDFDFDEFVQNIYASWQSRIQALGLTFDLHMDSNLPTYLKGDPTRLRQILVNLLGNAYKFTSDGSIALRVIAGGTKGNAVSVRFEVEDSGAGVPEEARSYLFEKFTQADPSTTRKYGGSGLGLAICKQLATLMGGEIGYDSTVGEGSTFWVTIVCQLGCEADVARGDSAELIDLPPLRVLVAEDDRINQQIISAIFGQSGAPGRHGCQRLGSRRRRVSIDLRYCPHGCQYA